LAARAFERFLCFQNLRAALQRIGRIRLYISRGRQLADVSRSAWASSRRNLGSKHDCRGEQFQLDCDALAAATIRYLINALFRISTGHKAYEYANTMAWTTVGERYRKLFTSAVRASRVQHRPMARDAAPTINWANTVTKQRRK
jgi:hypothetical protein